MFPTDALKRILEFEDPSGQWSGQSFATASWTTHNNVFKWSLSNTAAGKAAILAAIAQARPLPPWVVKMLDDEEAFRGVWKDMDDCSNLIALDIPNTLWGIGVNYLHCIVKSGCMRTAGAIMEFCKRRRDYDTIYHMYYHSLAFGVEAVVSAVYELCDDDEEWDDEMLSVDTLEAIEHMFDGNINLVDQVELCTDLALAVLPYHDHPNLVRFLVRVAFVDTLQIVNTVAVSRHRLCSFELMNDYTYDVGANPRLMQFVDEMPHRMPPNVSAVVWCATQNDNRDIANTVLRWAKDEITANDMSLKDLLIIGQHGADTEQWNAILDSIGEEDRVFVKSTIMDSAM